MIKFFRHIRYKLMEQGKTTRYFKYAIGEIFLVVIGILIALQINNWNQKRQELNQSVFYHEQIISDLGIVIASLSNDISWADNIKTKINQATTVLDNGQANDSTKKILDFALGNYFRLNRQLPEITSYEEMKSSGQLHLIYNKSLRNEISDYLRTHNITTNIYAELNTKVNQSEFLDPYVKFNEGSTLKDYQFTYDFFTLSANKIISNTLSRYAYHWEAKFTLATNLKKEAEKLKSIIENELDNLND